MKKNIKALAILSATHLVTDLNQGALPVLLPFFKEALNLSYTMAGVILMCGNLTSSVIQPAFGYISDRRHMGWLLPLAPCIASLGMSITGFMPSYFSLLLCVVISGIGVASFHPEGFKIAHFFTGEKKATGMSIFYVGGNLGISLGPICALTLITYFGLKGTLGMALPGISMGIILLLSISWLTTPVRTAFTKWKGERSPLSKKDISFLILLISVVIMRSWVHFGLVTYIPFFYIDYLKGDPLYAGKLVSTYLMAGILGTIAGSPLADRWGHKKFLSTTLLLTTPFLILFYNTEGSIIFVILAVSGMMLSSTFTVTIVMAQGLLPSHLGMVSGLMIGFAIGAGGIGVTLLGTIADHWGIPMCLKVIMLLPSIASLLSLFLPSPKGKTDMT
jgi:FSR family fosmidomycin resistance protein-like MFS transporter